VSRGEQTPLLRRLEVGRERLPGACPRRDAAVTEYVVLRARVIRRSDLPVGAEVLDAGDRVDPVAGILRDDQVAARAAERDLAVAGPAP
jgi:hypothetical protein